MPPHVGEPAKGQWRENLPDLGAGETGAFIKDAGTDLVHGVKHLVQESARGKIVPWLTNGRAARHTAMPEHTESTTIQRAETAVTT